MKKTQKESFEVQEYKEDVELSLKLKAKETGQGEASSYFWVEGRFFL